MTAKCPHKTHVVLIVLTLLIPLNAWPEPTLHSNTDTSTTGYFQLQWANKHATYFELQQARDQQFNAAYTLYRGTDTARTISGLSNGDYYYRVREHHKQTTGSWSAPIKVEVAHHSLGKAWAFFGLGLVTFSITLGTLIYGHRRQAS